MPRLTIFAREPEDRADIGAEEFAFVALRDIYDAERSGKLEADLLAGGFPFGAQATIQVDGRILNPLTGFDSTFKDLESEPTTIRSAAAVVGVVRALLRQRLSLPTSGSESGVKNSEHVYYTSEITLSWDFPAPPAPPAPPPPPPEPEPEPEPEPTPSPIAAVKAAVASAVSSVKSFFKRLLGR